MFRPLIIGIGGSRSGSGKTEAAVNILKALKGFGAIKFTKTALYSSITDDPVILRQEGKDTKRLLDAGAEGVLWVRSTPEGLKDTLDMAVEKLSHLNGIILEGNSAIEVLMPDIVIFIAGGPLKEGAEKILMMADAVIIEDSEQIPENAPKKAKGFRRDDIRGYTGHIKGEVMKQTVAVKIKENSVEGKISCAGARKIAEELGISYAEVGSSLNELRVKITDCALGCF